MAEEWEDGGGWAVDDLDDPTSRHELSADGALGEEYRAMKAAKAKARSPVRDPYHNAVEEPVASREPPKESFRLMVVGEAGLGKTTLLESFFKSFKDDEALFALFERKETQTVIETRRQLDDAAARRAVCEREMKVAAEKMEYAKAEAKKAEIARLDNESAQLATQLKRLESADERRRNELRLLRERARNVRMEMKRAADAQQYGAAAEKRLQAELLQEEVAALQAELKQMRRVEGEAYPVDEEHERSSAVLHSSTVRPRPPHTPERAPRSSPPSPQVVASLTRTPLKSPLAQCLLIRFAKKVMEDEAKEAGDRDRALFDFLEASLRHKSDMVIYEAASAICSLSNVTQRELSPAVTVLQLFLCSPKPCLRFSAVRTLNKVAMAHPLAVTPCNMDMEGLINDGNRSIATLVRRAPPPPPRRRLPPTSHPPPSPLSTPRLTPLPPYPIAQAITTLLKTGSESGVERLMKQITSFMSEIADEFKIVVVDAIRAMCLKFPQKHRLLMSFLSNVLREEGGFHYKKAIVDTLLIIIGKVPEAKEAGLAHLCEFIEDCEFTPLSTQILHLLGIEGPATADPAKCIRFLYNRVVT